MSAENHPARVVAALVQLAGDDPQRLDTLLEALNAATAEDTEAWQSLEWMLACVYQARGQMKANREKLAGDADGPGREPVDAPE